MKKRVIVEIKKIDTNSTSFSDSINFDSKINFDIDKNYEPIPLFQLQDSDETLALDAPTGSYLIRGEIDETQEEQLRKNTQVIDVWTDAIIHPFSCNSCGDEQSPDQLPLPEELSETETNSSPEATFDPEPELETNQEIDPPFDLELATPCPPTDCSPSVPKGTYKDVARFLKLDRLWAKGIRGQGVIIGIVDTGVNKTKIPACIGGWSPIPNYIPGSAPSSSHGTMCAFDASSMSPDSKIYDIAVLQSTGGIPSLVSDAIRGYHWALLQYRSGKGPHILSNSWGLYQKAWAPDYAINPNHPFTRKVVEVIRAGIIVTFAAGNCGQMCPSGACGNDTGPGKSIWGANGHPEVITVGAVNIKEEWIGYSSQGPSSLAAQKPDFCAPSHFTGARTSDNGTSAANPVCAGVIALLRSHDQSLNTKRAKDGLIKTAKNICSPGWDPHSGFGIIQGEAAFNYLFFKPKPIAHAMWIHGTQINTEYKENIVREYKQGSRTLIYGKPGTANWFHFAIPTPVIVEQKRLKIDNIMLQFYAGTDVVVTNVDIYDSYTRLKGYNNLQLTGWHLFERFDVIDRYLRYGIGISIRAVFGKKLQNPYIIFYSAGADLVH